VAPQRVRLHLADELADLGEDTSLLLDAYRRLFDLGLSGNETRFYLRIHRAAADYVLQGVLGQPLAQSLPVLTDTAR